MTYVALTLLCFLVYLPALAGPIRLHDDQASILARGPEFESRPGFWVLLRRFWTSPSRPTYNTVNLWNYKLCRFWSPGWHLVNYGLHALTTCTLLHTLTRLGWPEPAWLAVAFAVHPLQTQSVAYVSGRSGLIAVFFLLLFANSYLWPFPWCLISPLPLVLAYNTREDSIIALTWMPFLEWFR